MSNQKQEPDVKPTPLTINARAKALQIIRDKVEIRPFDEHKEEDGNHNFVHRRDAITAVDIVAEACKSIERQLSDHAQLLAEKDERLAVVESQRDTYWLERARHELEDVTKEKDAEIARLKALYHETFEEGEDYIKERDEAMTQLSSKTAEVERLTDIIANARILASKYSGHRQMQIAQPFRELRNLLK